MFIHYLSQSTWIHLEILSWPLKTLKYVLAYRTVNCHKFVIDHLSIMYRNYLPNLRKHFQNLIFTSLDQNQRRSRSFQRRESPLHEINCFVSTHFFSADSHKNLPIIHHAIWPGIREGPSHEVSVIKMHFNREDCICSGFTGQGREQRIYDLLSWFNFFSSALLRNVFMGLWRTFFVKKEVYRQQGEAVK